MFIAHKSDFIPSFYDGEFNFTKLELPAYTPWFICEVPQFEDGEEEAVCTSNFLIDDVNKLSEFAAINKIDKTYIVSPGYMTKTNDWSLLRLKSISLATHLSDDNETQIYKFEIEEGKFITYGLNGVENQNNGLKFRTILEFD